VTWLRVMARSATVDVFFTVAGASYVGPNISKTSYQCSCTSTVNTLPVPVSLHFLHDIL